MKSINSVFLIDDVTRDAELRSTKPILNTGRAMNRMDGGEERSQFPTIICWDRRAGTTGVYVEKGDPLYVEGRLEYRIFQDEEGKERGVYEIIASDIGFLGRRPSVDGVGGMGIHYLTPAYFEQAFVTQSAEITEPVALLYDPRGNDLKLVGVEYFFPIVIAETGEIWWGETAPDAAIETAPTLFGQWFDGPMSGPEPGMPAHYDMHVWLWQVSPDSLFTTWNRNGDCPAQRQRASRVVS